MAIAKGLSNNNAERNVVTQGFYEQLEVAQQSQCVQETNIKVKLCDIMEDNELGEEEKETLRKPLLNELEEIENKHIRIRCAIFIGLYSFWEVSLKSISSSHSFCSLHDDNEPLKKEQASNKSIAWKYLNRIYGVDIPNNSLLIDGAIRVCRNCLVHGRLSSTQKETIKELEISNPEFGIRIICGDCAITSYTGLRYLLEVISKELHNAELTSIKRGMNYNIN